MTFLQILIISHFSKKIKHFLFKISLHNYPILATLATGLIIKFISFQIVKGAFSENPSKRPRFVLIIAPETTNAKHRNDRITSS